MLLEKFFELLDSWYEEAIVVGGIKSITTEMKSEFGALKLARPVEVTIVERKSGQITWIVGHYVRVVGWNVREIESACHSRLLAKLREVKQRVEDAREDLQDILSIVPEYNESETGGAREQVQGGGQSQAEVQGPDVEGQVRSGEGGGGSDPGQG